MRRSFLTTVLLLIWAYSTSQLASSTTDDFVHTVYYRPNSFILSASDQKNLDAIVDKINSETFSYLKVFGYADPVGSEEFNEQLSKKRAEHVYAYLSKHSKLDSSRAYVTWIGESAEAYDLHLPKAHAQQRCVDILIQFSKPK